MAELGADVIAKLFDKIAEDGGIIGGHILISEVLKDDHLELQVYVSRGITPWSAAGMLGEAMAIIPQDDLIQVEFEGDPFDYEEDYEDDDDQ